MANNKVTFGLKNVHYAVLENDDGEVTYQEPIPVPGAVELALEPRGDLFEFYADNLTYYSVQSNQGYDGTLEIADVPQSFLVDVLGEDLNIMDGVITETTTAKTKSFALLFEFDGDQHKIRHVMYNCTANRPSIGSSTKTESTEPNTNELTFVSSPVIVDGKPLIKTKTTRTVPLGVYNEWFNGVFIPSESDGQLYAADFIGVKL